MGYSTTYRRKILIDPPLNAEELAYLRRQLDDPTKPTYGCGWVPTDDGAAIVWDGRNDRFYFKEAIDWMHHLINHFLKPDSTTRQAQPAELGFLAGHICNGTIKARIDEFNQNMELIVTDNVVSRRDLPNTAEQTPYYHCPHCHTAIQAYIVVGPPSER